MTEREALKLALEALEKYAHDFGSSDLSVKAMYVARNALAQPDQLFEENERLHVENRRLIDRIETIGVPVGVGGYVTTTSQPEQEPVAWLHRQGNFTEACMNPLHDDEIDRGWTQQPLYTTPPQRTDQEQQIETLKRCLFQMQEAAKNLVEQAKSLPPPQRTWVGLTPQERDEINEQVYGAVPHHVAFHHAIEAKLKEKNT